MKTQAQDFILLSEQNKYGHVHIQKQVFNAIAVTAVSDEKNARIIERYNQKEIQSKIKDNDLIIDINLKVLYGQNVNEITTSVQTKIAQNIEFMTGFKCDRINVKIDGFYFNAQ